MPDASDHCKRLTVIVAARQTRSAAGANERPAARLQPSAAIFDLRPTAAKRHQVRLCATRPPIVSQRTSVCKPISNAKNEQADRARPHRWRPRLISQYARTHEADQAAGGVSEEGADVGLAFLRLAGARLAADFFAAPFLPAVFFAAVLLAVVFFAEAFFTAPLRVAFLATTLRAVFLAGFLAADFFAVFLVAALGMYHVPLNHPLLSATCALCRCASESTFVLISRKRCTCIRHASNAVTIEL